MLEPYAKPPQNKYSLIYTHDNIIFLQMYFKKTKNKNKTEILNWHTYSDKALEELLLHFCLLENKWYRDFLQFSRSSYDLSGWMGHVGGQVYFQTSPEIFDSYLSLVRWQVAISVRQRSLCHKQLNLAEVDSNQECKTIQIQFHPSEKLKQSVWILIPMQCREKLKEPSDFLNQGCCIY